MMQLRSAILTLSLVLATSAHPALDRRASFTLKNGQDAIALNEKFSTLTADSSCQSGENACVDQKFAQCVNGKFVLQACGPGTICSALPLVNSPGTSITCTTEADAAARIAATGAQSAGGNTGIDSGSGDNDAGAGGATGNDNDTGNDGGANNAGAGGAAGNDNNAGNNGGANNAGAGGAAGNDTGDDGGANNAGADGAAGNDGNNDPQKSLTLDPAVIAEGFANNGQDVPVDGQAESLTSTNNFINFCKDIGLPITNGQQKTGGSCNPAPMGAIPSTSVMPSSKFAFPKNGGTVPANEKFSIKMAIKNVDTGNFVNADSNYYAAPQHLNAQGIIIGHSHVVVEKLDSLTQTTPTDPKVFAFFKGVNGEADAQGILTVNVDKGLPAGTYKLSSINAAANHQPVLVAVAQHGSLDDVVYFTVQ